MADANTIHYSLIKIEVGASDDTWGAKLNTNFDDIDSQMKVNADAAAANAAAISVNDGDIAANGAAIGVNASAISANSGLIAGLAAANTGDEVLATTSVAGVVELCTVDQVRNFSNQVFTASTALAGAAEYALSDAGTISHNMNHGQNAVVTLGGNRTLGNLVNPKVGVSGRIRVIQDGTGNRTLTLDTNYYTRDGEDIVLSKGSNDIDVLYYDVITPTMVYVSLVRGLEQP